MTSTAPPFAAQRIIFTALIIGMTLYALTAGFVIQANDGKGLMDPPLELLDQLAPAVGGFVLVGALVVRAVLGRQVANASDPQMVRFMQRLMPIAMLEGGCLFAITAWMLSGNAVPALATALVLLAIAIAIVPFQDPDAGT